ASPPHPRCPPRPGAAPSGSLPHLHLEFTLGPYGSIISQSRLFGSFILSTIELPGQGQRRTPGRVRAVGRTIGACRELVGREVVNDTSFPLTKPRSGRVPA